MSNGAGEVLVEKRGVVAVITLNRPERRNALSSSLMNQISQAIDASRLDSQVRAMVLTGAPPVFSAGMDLKEAHRPASFSASEGERAAIISAQSYADLIAQIHDCPKPIIGAIGGDAMAGGAGLAMACDLVIAVEGVSFGYPEVKRGMVAAIVMHDLVRLVGERRARQLLLTGESISASDALQWGLVNRVVKADDCLSAAVEQGAAFARLGPIAVATTKTQLSQLTRSPRDLRGAAAVSAAIRVSDEAIEGITAFIEKRRPRWDVSN